MQDITEYKIIEFSKAILIYGIISAILIGLGVYSFFTSRA